MSTTQRHCTKFSVSRRLAKELGSPGLPEGVFEGISLVLPCEHMWSLISCDFKTLSVHLQWSAFSMKFSTTPQQFSKLPLEAAYNHLVFSEFYKSSAYMNNPLGEFAMAHSKLVLNLKEEWMRNHALECPSPILSVMCALMGIVCRGIWPTLSNPSRISVTLIISLSAFIFLEQSVPFWSPLEWHPCPPPPWSFSMSSSSLPQLLYVF